jgi:23S rRNA (cytosine1962-C5)-methyltransferase
VRPVWSGHPWVFAQAVARIEGGAVAGDEVTVVDPTGSFLGRGLYTPRSAIPVRIYTRDPECAVDASLIRQRIERALAHRHEIGLPDASTTAYRLIHAEGDGLPGLIVDVLGDVASVQLNTIGIKRREGAVFDALTSALRPRAILDRTPAGAAQAEGFELTPGVVRGDSTIDRLSFVERGLSFTIPLSIGQKTGFYLDQRPLRARIEQLSRGRRVLDAFSFVGAFSMAAARGGATEVVAIDDSALALEIGAECARENGLGGVIQFTRGDARKLIEQVSRPRPFDLTICDPPKLAPSRGSKEGALGAYRKLASAACRATRPGGLAVICSCSAAVGIDDLTRAVALGARDARMEASVLERHFQGPDHPVPASFPEGLYLKSVIARVDALQ